MSNRRTASSALVDRPETSRFVGNSEADLSVEASSPAEGRVQGVGPVGGPDDHDWCWETVQI